MPHTQYAGVLGVLAFPDFETAWLRGWVRLFLSGCLRLAEQFVPDFRCL